jgi:hypothetical protein
MGNVIGNIIGIVLVLAVVTIALKILFFVLGLLFGFLGLVGVLLKLAIIGGLIYLACVFLRKLFAERQTI